MDDKYNERLCSSCDYYCFPTSNGDETRIGIMYIFSLILWYIVYKSTTWETTNIHIQFIYLSLCVCCSCLDYFAKIRWHFLFQKPHTWLRGIEYCMVDKCKQRLATGVYFKDSPILWCYTNIIFSWLNWCTMSLSENSA